MQGGWQDHYGQELRGSSRRQSAQTSPADSTAGRRRFPRHVAQVSNLLYRGFLIRNPRPRTNLQVPHATDWKAVRRGWCLGDKTFKAELLEQMHGGWQDHYGQELRGSSGRESAQIGRAS